MAMATANGTTPPLCKLHVEGIQTVVPTKPTEPRKSTTVVVPQNATSAAVLQRRFHVLLCYNKASDGDSGWLVAGRIKESLGRALQEEPLLAGRMRRREGGLEIVSNDSGVRLVEARAEMRLDEFGEMEMKKEVAAELVFWEDVVDQNPQFSPLFYVQVTNFTCGGYSIGISCSLLLIDPFILTTFIKKWANIHNNMVPKTATPQIPTFYLPNHGKPPSSPALLMGPNTFNHSSETLIFKTPTKILNLENNTHKNLAAQCIVEAERVTGRKMASNLSLFVKLPYEDAKVEICLREGLLESLSLEHSVNGEISCARTWDELELDSVCFNEGKKAYYASCWINSVVDQGSVMVVPFDDNTLGVQIVVTFT